MAPSKKAKAQPKNSRAGQPQEADGSQDAGGDFNKEVTRMRALMKYRASAEYKSAALGLFSIRSIHQQMSHPCNDVAVVFRRLTISCGCGVQEISCA